MHYIQRFETGTVAQKRSQHTRDPRFYALLTSLVVWLLESTGVVSARELGRPLELDMPCAQATLCVPEVVDGCAVAC